MEKKFIDVDFATRTYKLVVRRTIDLGVRSRSTDYFEWAVD